MKTPHAYDTLAAAVTIDSPEGFLRNAALRALGALGDDKAVPLVREWAAPGKDIEARRAAISSLARLQKDNKEITQQLAGYLTEPHFPVRMTSIFALGTRGDASAVPALEALLKSNDLSIEMVPMIKQQIDRLKNPSAKNGPQRDFGDEDGFSASEETTAPRPAEDQRLTRLEQLLQQMNERLKAIESRLAAQK